MAGLGSFGAWRHVVVGGAVSVVGLAAGTGIIGEERTEHFDSKQVLVTPVGTTGLRMREVVDFDFGNEHRHGYERIVNNDFGAPTDVTAQSADAPDEVSVNDRGSDTVIRIGDPDVTVSGQHRYTLSYTLASVEFARPGTKDPQLALDIINNDETLTTDTFEIVVSGYELTDPLCNVGAFGSSGGCELVDDGEVFRAVVSPLEPGDGITIGGTIVGSRPVVDVAAPALPDTPPDHRIPVTAGSIALGLAAGGGTYAWARRKGRNEVTPGGAADAAYGVAPPPGDWATALAPPSGTPSTLAPPAVRLVADSKMAELATTEFVPPKGVDPWLGNVLLNERITPASVQAWVSGYAAREVLTVERDDDGKVVMSRGPKYLDAPGDDLAILDQMLGDDGTITLGTYSKSFAAAWAKVRSKQAAHVKGAGYWKRPLPGSVGSVGVGSAGALGAFALLAMVWLALTFGSAAARKTTIFDSPWFALGIGLVLPGILAVVLYSRMLPARTASGSAMALRTESFRRFLVASEGPHVEWAWKQGLLREYSAWAVALGAADAWEHALQGSSVPPAEFANGPLIVYYAASSFGSTVRAPGSSSGGHSGFGGGGFSGGSVGGGGGGGSSGSW